MDDDNQANALPMLGSQVLVPHLHWQLGAIEQDPSVMTGQSGQPICPMQGPGPSPLLPGCPGQQQFLGEPMDPILLHGQPGQQHVLEEPMVPMPSPFGPPAMVHGLPGQQPVVGNSLVPMP